MNDPRATQRFGLHVPLETHFRPASCEEAECPHYLMGWMTVVNEGTDLGKTQADYIRHRAGRRFTETKGITGLTEFRFYAGQRCFRQHQVHREEMAPIFTHKVGTGPRERMEGHEWMDTMNEEAYKLERDGIARPKSERNKNDH